VPCPIGAAVNPLKRTSFGNCRPYKRSGWLFVDESAKRIDIALDEKKKRHKNAYGHITWLLRFS
ncbi:hypothetical protein BIW11_05904, partial [Tropilaelaps mercedesae]